MVNIPKLPSNLSSAQKLAALDAAEPSNTATLADKETGGKPWLLAEKKNKFAHASRIDGDINAKLDFVLEQMGRGVSKNALINQALNEFTNRWLAENGHI